MKTSRFMILSLLALSLGTVAQASEPARQSQFNFTFFGNSGGNFTMVSCDYAEYLVQDWMEKFGALKITTFCSGGIQPYGVYPLSLNVAYDAPILGSDTRTDTVTIDSRSYESNCVFDGQLMKALLRDFTNVKAKSFRDFCFRPDDSYSYVLDVTTSK